MIKKVLLIIFVVFTFFIYSFNQRSESNGSSLPVADTTKPSGQSSTATSSTGSSTYNDGSYTGKASDALYGYIKVKATISSGKITNIEFLEYPNDRGNSTEINNYAMPRLKQQAIQAQSAQVDGISGATDTSIAFIESLSDALNQAKI